MQRHSVEAIVSALNAAQVRYLIAGGLAVVAHGYVRFTADLDMIVALDAENVGRAVAALAALGFRPRAPVPFDALADPAQRAAWVRDRQMTVFSVSSAAHPATEVDIFVEAPLDFDEAYRRRASMQVSPGTAATFVSRDDLLQLKRAAGRPQDLADIDALGRLTAHPTNDQTR